jgi:hypothetical protein
MLRHVFAALFADSNFVTDRRIKRCLPCHLDYRVGVNTYAFGIRRYRISYAQDPFDSQLQKSVARAGSAVGQQALAPYLRIFDDYLSDM